MHCLIYRRYAGGHVYEAQTNRFFGAVYCLAGAVPWTGSDEVQFSLSGTGFFGSDAEFLPRG